MSNNAWKPLGEVKRGTAVVPCPLRRCGYAKRFIETEQTLASAAETKRQREEYLRLDHKTGHSRGG
jgi:hypothetical protein